jgi:hypothetical protein
LILPSRIIIRNPDLLKRRAHMARRHLIRSVLPHLREFKKIAAKKRLCGSWEYHEHFSRSLSHYEKIQGKIRNLTGISGSAYQFARLLV